MMKKCLLVGAAFALLFACKPENNPGDNGGGDSPSSVVELTGITLSEHIITLEKGGNMVLEVKFTPEDAANKTLTWVSSNTSVATVADGIVVGVAPGSTEVIVKSGNLIDKCQVRVELKIEAIDLGLPSRLKWGSRNVGAFAPEWYGDYYAWGEVEAKDGYGWGTYRWGSGSKKLTKYNTDASYGSVDDKTRLEPNDDAAQVNLGGNWRMPTDDEWTELTTECTYKRTTQNGVKGVLVTGKNGNSIFLPAAGYWDGGSLRYVGQGYYWSSSLCTDKTLGPDPSSAMGVMFYFTGDYKDIYRSVCSRYVGRSVRPVTE